MHQQEQTKWKEYHWTMTGECSYALITIVSNYIKYDNSISIRNKESVSCVQAVISPFFSLTKSLF